MKYATVPRVCIIAVLICLRLQAGSIVYNFRIAQITKQSLQEKSNHSHYTLVALLFDQFQKRRSGIKENYAGGLASVIYNAHNYYARIDTALARFNQKKNMQTLYRNVQTDDLLFTVGRNFMFDNDRSLLTLSGLFGVPTHRNNALRSIDFGYAQVGAGLQLDGSYLLNEQTSSGLLYGARYIYYVPRTTFDCSGNRYRFSIGNIGDILGAYKRYWENTHGIELGYSFRSDFGASVSPVINGLAHQTNYNRSNFYFVYKYKLPQGHTMHRFLFNISYGFDHGHKREGYKSIVTLWGSWNVNF